MNKVIYDLDAPLYNNGGECHRVAMLLKLKSLLLMSSDKKQFRSKDDVFMCGIKIRRLWLKT